MQVLPPFWARSRSVSGVAARRNESSACVTSRSIEVACAGLARASALPRASAATNRRTAPA
jgi:hypothetical protein